MLLDFVNKLKETSSTNKKQEIIKEFDNKRIRKILNYTYSPLINFNIKKFPNVPAGKHSINKEKNIDRLINLLEALHTKAIPQGNVALQKVASFLSKFEPESQKVIKSIISKDLKCGINIKLINKAIPKLIYECYYMGAVPYSKDKVDRLFEKATEVWAEIKYDGMFINLIVDDNFNLFTLSRKGKNLYLEDDFDNYISPKMRGYVLTGELMIHGFDRYTANGIIRSYVTLKEKIKKGKITQKEIDKFEKRYGLTLKEVSKRLYIKLWDIIKLEHFFEKKWNVPLKNRRELLKKFLGKNKKLVIVKHIIIKDKQEALLYFKKALAKGFEGIILKDANYYWRDGKPNQQIKFKITFDVDLLVVDYKYGRENTKYENVINRLVCQSSCGKLKTTTSAMKEDEMEELTDIKDDIVGKIVTIECSGLSKNKEGNYSLLHPRFVCIRDDKDKADSLEQIKEIEKMIMEI